MFVQVFKMVANLICISYSAKATSQQREPLPRQGCCWFYVWHRTAFGAVETCRYVQHIRRADLFEAAILSHDT